MAVPPYTSAYASLIEESSKRTLLLDGAVGTMLPTSEAVPDLFSLTNKDIVRSIHLAYLQAGADIITTNSINSNTITLDKYGIGNKASEIAGTSAQLARGAVEEFMEIQPGRRRYVAGSVGPIIPPNGNTSADEQKIYDAYRNQIQSLIDGGCDILLIETITDLWSAHTAFQAAKDVFRERNEYYPVMLSATLRSDGNLISGETIDDFSHLGTNNLFSIGFNCSLGVEMLLPHCMQLAEAAGCRVSCHPNAWGGSSEKKQNITPEQFLEKVLPYLKPRCIDIIGGCCGTTPAHIKELYLALQNL